MKREIVPPPKGLLFMYRIIMALLLALVAILIAGSLYAFLRPPVSEPLFSIGNTSAAGGRQTNGRQTDPFGFEDSMFTGIGRLRIPVSGAPSSMPVTVILSVSFPYSPHDRPFAEELASRIGDFRSIANNYFSSLSLEAIINLDEEAAKADILRRYNALLRLGRIETLYFSDFMLVE